MHFYDGVDANFSGEIYEMMMAKDRETLQQSKSEMRWPEACLVPSAIHHPDEFSARWGRSRTSVAHM